MCYPTLHTSGQSTVGSAEVDRKTRQQIEQTVRSFVEAYRKGRDFKDCFQAFFVTDAVERMKLAGFFESMDMDRALIQDARTDELTRAYVAVMNYHFASLAYEFNFPKAPVPRELTSHKEDLARFTREFEYAAEVYRRLLPRSAFKSSNYRRRIAENMTSRLSGAVSKGTGDGSDLA